MVVMWAYFEGQLINISEFERFYRKGDEIQSINKREEKILFNRYESEDFAKESIIYLDEIVREDNESD